ncbi:hypothetical protein IQ277_36370 [Nostocales cyanobacterium LEGE 12452]|nr:hypothetical protein [Nostocales cyanobacterium LEGE 12452]
MTLATYAMFCAALLYVLYFIVQNINVKKAKKADPKPKVKPLKLFTGSNGIPEKLLKEKFNWK